LKTLPHLALDFESFYDTTLSLKKMGVQEYLSQTEVYLVSAYDGNGLSRVCHPNEFNWLDLHGRTIVSHNANFDAQVFTHLQQKGVIPRIVKPAEWNCTANLAAYCGAPRGLEGACRHFFGITASKDIRKRLRGKHWDLLKPEFRAQVIEYALNDSKNCWRIWQEYSEKWPALERLFSLLTLSMCAYGVQLDAEQLEESRSILDSQKMAALDKIPWRPPLSYACFKQACDQEAITPPKSLAMADEECDAWMEMYSGRFPWVEAMRNYRRCNILNRKIDKMLSRQRGDGRMPFELKYWGSHTGRDSGSGGVNMQNLPHGELYGVDLRSAIVAPPDMRLIVADLSQIEARILLTLVKDELTLDLIRGGQSPYEAHARATMGFSEPILPKTIGTYRLAKARVLALGYGAGWRKFNIMAYLPVYLGRDAARVFSEPVSKSDVAAFSEYLLRNEKDKATREKWHNRTQELETEWTNAWLIVNAYRKSNPRIVSLWGQIDGEIRKAVGQDWDFKLPNGRSLRYRSIKETKENDLTCSIIRGDKEITVKIYGARIVENIVQAIARDIFMEACLRVHDAGYRIIMRIHDELVAEVLARVAEEARLQIESLMGASPAWLDRCPVSAEAKITEKYLK